MYYQLGYLGSSGRFKNRSAQNHQTVSRLLHQKRIQWVVRQFEGFRKEVGYSPTWLVPVELKKKGPSISTISRNFSALVFANKVLGLVIYRNFRIKKMLEGWPWEASPKGNGRQPLSP